MPRLPDLLHRFLPAGAPGAAGVAGVPTDRVADEAAELAPLFARLAHTEAQCDEIAQHAEQDAAATRERAAAQIRAILASAQQRVASERAEALARARKAMQQQADVEYAAANEQAAQLRERTLARLPAYVARVTTAITDMIAATGSADAT